jgi:hypothetical protein
VPNIRNVEEIARASQYEKHGTTFLGGSFRACICPKSPCGGVATADERPGCPEHDRDPAQLWHWAAECPGQAAS